MKVLCERCGALAEGRLEARAGGGAALACGACGAEIALTPRQAAPEGSTSPAASSTATSTPDAPETSTPPGTSTPTPTAEPPDEGQAWAEVLARWDDEEAHRAFLARFGDLDGLAEAGRRYREVLSERPGDATALRWRDEILKRATAQGLSQLPRLSPPRASPRVYRWAVVGGMAGAMALAAGWLAWRLLALARG